MKTGKKEIKNIFESQGSKDEKLWIDVMKEVDKNNDGEINFEEFLNVMTISVDRKF